MAAFLQWPVEIQLMVINGASLKLRGRLDLVCRAFSALLWRDTAFYYPWKPRNPVNKVIDFYGAKVGKPGSRLASTLTTVGIGPYSDLPLASPGLIKLLSCENLTRLYLTMAVPSVDPIEVIGKACPKLRKLCLRAHGLYLSIYPNSFALLPKSLIALGLLETFYRDIEALVEPVLEGIARHLGPTLQILSVATGNCRALKSMLALRELYVTSNFFSSLIGRVPDLIPHLLSETPPGVGLNICWQIPMNDMGEYTSLFTYARSKEEVDLLLASGFDPARLLCRGSVTVHPSTTHMLRTFEKDSLTKEDAKVLFQSKLPPESFVLHPTKGKDSVFQRFLFNKNSGEAETWSALASFLFGEPFAFVRSRYTIPQLFGPNRIPGTAKDPDPLPIRLTALAYVDVNFVPRLKFVLEHPEFFGEQSPEAVDRHGNGLSHRCQHPTMLVSLTELLHLNWKISNKKGQTALQYHFFHYPTLATALFSQLPDEDFVREGTPSVWSRLSVDGPNRPQLRRCIERLIKLIPEAQWSHLLGPLLYTMLASAKIALVLDLLKHADLSYSRAIALALVRVTAAEMQPFTQNRYNIEIYNTKVRPIPHLIVAAAAKSSLLGQALLRHVVSAVRKLPGYKTDAQISTWFSQRDADGKNCLQDVSVPAQLRSEVQPYLKR